MDFENMRKILGQGKDDKGECFTLVHPAHTEAPVRGISGAAPTIEALHHRRRSKSDTSFITGPTTHHLTKEKTPSKI